MQVKTVTSGGDLALGDLHRLNLLRWIAVDVKSVVYIRRAVFWCER